MNLLNDILEKIIQSIKNISLTPGPQGSQGVRGTGYITITVEPMPYTTVVDGITPAYAISRGAVLNNTSGVDTVLIGDTLVYNDYHYPVIYLKGSVVYCGERKYIRGRDGVTFTPSVDDSGILSWSNSGNLVNPSPVQLLKNIDPSSRLVVNTSSSSLLSDSGLDLKYAEIIGHMLFAQFNFSFKATGSDRLLYLRPYAPVSTVPYYVVGKAYIYSSGAKEHVDIIASPGATDRQTTLTLKLGSTWASGTDIWAHCYIAMPIA